MEMPFYILSILRTQLPIVMSWGAHNFQQFDENTLRFSVQGFLLNGIVEVKYNWGTDLFDIRTWDKKGASHKDERDVYADQLVDTIDGIVEKCENYDERVKEEYNIN